MPGRESRLTRRESILCYIAPGFEGSAVDSSMPRPQPLYRPQAAYDRPGYGLAVAERLVAD